MNKQLTTTRNFCSPEMNETIRLSLNYLTLKHKEKYHLLSNAVRDCEYTVCRYVNKKNLSTLSEDETLHNLLKHYKELLYIQSLPEEEVFIEKISDEMSEIENLYFSDMDPYYQEDFEELA